MKCPSCGAENDPTNRFCDQCGTRLEAAGQTAGQTAAPVAAAPPVVGATSTCPNCGATVLPGEAFCDECGTALNPTATPASFDAPTVFTPPQASASGSAASSDAGPICPACGHQNLPGDRFCDNCGAALDTSVAASPPPVNDAPTIEAEALDSSAGTPTSSAPVESPSAVSADQISVGGDGDGSQPPAGEPPAPPPTPQEEPPTPAPTPKEEPPTPAPTPQEAPPAEEPVPAQTQAPAMDQATYEAERSRLEGLMTQHQQIIAQLEPVQNALGAATPAGVAQSLEEARRAVAQAQAELDALQPPAPAVDPAEVARLEGLITQHRQIIAQLEPVQNALGAATPAGVAQSLEEARRAVAQAQAELDALTGGRAPARSAPESVPTVIEAPAGAQDMTPEELAAAPTILDVTPQPMPATPAPQPQLPRFVLDEGRELVLPANKNEIVIGREDPISGIFPEIDLTPYGGESGGVSRQHARLNLTNGIWTLTDLNSTNYTRVDGTKIDPNNAVTIKDGTRIQFGRLAMTFRAQ